MIVSTAIKIPPHTAQVVESERGGGKLPLNVACFFHKAPELPAGLRIDPFVSEMQEEGLFRLVVVNSTHQPITLPRFQVLGRVALHQSHLKETVQIASCTSEPKSVDPAKYDAVLKHIPPRDASKLRALLEENSDAFASETKELGCTGLVKHTIDTQGQGPIRLLPYRTSPRQREVANKIIDELLENQIIQPSTSPWSAPIVLVKKKSGEDRLCIDYRRLNAAITKKGFISPATY
jgi:hypothetical protein